MLNLRNSMDQIEGQNAETAYLPFTKREGDTLDKVLELWRRFKLVCGYGVKHEARCQHVMMSVCRRL